MLCARFVNVIVLKYLLIMSLLMKYSQLNRVKNFKNIINNVTRLSTQAQPQDLPVESAQEYTVSTRVIKKKPNKPPFMKNVFLGNFDTDALAFPEVLDKEELKDVNEQVSQLSQYLSEQNSVQRLWDLKNKNLNVNIFGLQSSKNVDGLELSETENCRILETISNSRSLAISLINHQYLGVKAIASKGNEKVIQKYLGKLSRGEYIAAFCLLEEANQDPALMKTNATLTEDGRAWILNGNKSWVVNGSQGNIYIVVANTHDEKDLTVGQDRMSVFVIEKNSEGILTTPCKSSGFKDSDICNISFNNTRVPAENMLGEGADSLKILTPLLAGLRLSTGPGCISLLHNLIRQFSEYTLQTKHGEKYICDTDFIKDKLAKININLYAVESVTYMTTGLLDKYEKQDCELESAIVKVFCSEKCLDSVQECLKLLGSEAFMEDHWLNSLHNDALGHVLLNETNDSLRIVISLLGLQYAGVGLKDNVKKLRNPFYFPGYIVKKMFEQRRQAADDPKLNMILENYLHPSLTLSARWLEYCVYRLQYATETMLIRHGPQIVDQHMELKRLANVALDVYAMVSVLSRASRSYCIGLQNADYELLLANSYCLDARDRVKYNVEEIVRGPYGTNDVNFQKIAVRALKFNGYFAEHVLTKNF